MKPLDVAKQYVKTYTSSYAAARDPRKEYKISTVRHLQLYRHLLSRQMPE